MTRCDHGARAGVAALVREFPRVPTVALLTQLDRSTPQPMLSLGSTGVRQLVDVREAEGWRELRNCLLATRGEDIQRHALGQLAIDLSGVPQDCWRFFEALFLAPPRVSTVRVLARRLDVLPSTLMSRFFRARLPAPKQYLATARLVRAARLFENPGLLRRERREPPRLFVAAELRSSCANAHALTAVEFRERYDGEGMLQHFRQRSSFRTSSSCGTCGPSAPSGAHRYRETRSCNDCASPAHRRQVAAGISGTISLARASDTTSSTVALPASRGPPPRDRPARARQPRRRRPRAPRRSPFAPSRRW